MNIFKTNFRGPYWLALLVLVVGLGAGCGSQPQTPQTPAPGAAPTAPQQLSALPFTVTLRAIDAAGWNGGHSFATAEHEGKVIIVGGRTNGLHNFPTSASDAEQAFPRSMANNKIILLNPATGLVEAEASVDTLPSPINLHLRSSNAQYHSENGWLYYVGGYGDDPANPTMITMPYVTAINIQGLYDALTNSEPLDETFRNDHIAFTDNFAAVRVTGGDMQPVYNATTEERIANTFFIVFGHQFDGLYYANGAAARQVYRNRVQNVYIEVLGTTSSDNVAYSWKLQTEDLGSNPSPVQYTENLPPDNPYHRRDLTVAPSFRPGGGMAVTAYGGVFKNDLGGYLEPMYIQSYGYGQTSVNEDVAAKQLLSHYKCPVIQMFDKTTQTMYSTFFAGISYYYWDQGQGGLVHDPVELPQDGLPFIDSVSTMISTADNTSSSTVQYLIDGLTFPPAGDSVTCDGQTAEYLGAETHFIPNENSAIQMFNNGVIDYDHLKTAAVTPQVIGYLVGGIASTSPYSSNEGAKTCASNRIYELTIQMTPSAVTALSMPAQ